MEITIKQLCNVANEVIINSEPYHWYDEVFEQGQMLFENTNTQEQFYLPITAKPVEHIDDAFSFYAEHLDKTIWIEFYKHIPITEQDL